MRPGEGGWLARNQGQDVDSTTNSSYIALVLKKDDRRDYGEQRCMALGECCGHLLVVVFTVRDNAFRIISARKANARERNKYEQRT